MRVTLPAVIGSLEFDGGEAWVWRCGWNGVDLVFEVGLSAVPTSPLALTALEEELEVRFPFHVGVQGPGSETASVIPGDGALVLPQHQRSTIGMVSRVSVRVPAPHRDMTLSVDLLGLRVCEVTPFAEIELAP